MSRSARFLASFAFTSFAAIALAQGAPSHGAPETSTAKVNPTPVIRTSAQLVVVDVVVTDSSHKLVHGLAASDFALTENGVPQKLRSLEEHSTLAAAATTPEPPLPRGIFTNVPAVPPGGAVNILLLDSLNTPTSDQIYVRNQLLVYLKSAAPGARTAIYGLTDHLLLLQGFDSDPAALRNMLIKMNSKASPIRSDQTGDGIQESAADTFEDSEDPMFAELVANLRQWDAQQQSLELQMRAKYTIDAFNQLASALAAIPGRKNLIWFSASFPLNVLPNTSTNPASSASTPGNDNFLNSFAGEADMSDEFRGAIDRLSRSQVAVYPIDARGVTQSAVYAADTTRNYGGARGAGRYSADQSQFLNDTAAENGTMTSLANATGGHAYLSTNDLARAMKESVEQGSNFYSLSYTPTDTSLDGKLRRIKVQISHPGAVLSYRQSYYAVPADPVKTAGLITQTDAAAGVNDPSAVALRKNLRLAMTRGAPAPTDILFRVGVVPATPADKPEEIVAPQNTPTAKAKGLWRRYSVNYQIDPAGLIFFSAPNGNIHSDWDLIVFVYTAQGELMNVVNAPRAFMGSEQEVRDFYRHGIVQHVEVSVPTKGEYFLRIAIHDLHRDHYGAVEIATSQVSNVVATDRTAEVPAATTKPQ